MIKRLCASAAILLYTSSAAFAQTCGLQDTQWETPSPTVVLYPYGGGWISGVPDPVNSVASTDPKGIFERYVYANADNVPVSSVRVGLGGLVDADDDMRFQIAIYQDNAGTPGALIGQASALISPTSIGVANRDPESPNPTDAFTIDMPFPVPTGAAFHVGLTITPGDSIDRLIVATSCLGPTGCPVAEGEADASNHILTTGFGFENLLTVYGADFDVELIPFMARDASFSYGQAVYGITEPDPTPTVDGVAGGTFSGSPAGLALDANTGTIDLSASAVGDYSITYTSGGTCPGTESFDVNIFDDTPVELLEFSID